MSKRHDDLSRKLFKMGFALIEEGEESNDENVVRIGEFIVLISGLVHDKDDIEMFGHLCAMFSAKKILDSEMLSGKYFPNTEEGLDNFINKLKGEIDGENDNEDDDKDNLDTDLDEGL